MTYRPWLYHRDEFNLLEEDFEGVLRSHERGDAKSRRFRLEQSVIDEQARTEEASEAALTERLGPDWAAVAILSGDAQPAQEVDDSLSLKETLRRGADRDPLYVRARDWARGVYRWTRDEYHARGRETEDIYRAHLNACLVPIKLCFGLSELEHMDMHALDIAEKEFELAETYLRRTLEPLVALSEEGTASEPLQTFIREARELGAELRRCREEVLQKKRFGPGL